MKKSQHAKALKIRYQEKICRKTKHRWSSGKSVRFFDNKVSE